MRYELSVEQWPQTRRKNCGAHLANRRRVATTERPKNHATEKRRAACFPLRFVQYDERHNFWICWQYLAIPPITIIGNYYQRTVFLCSFCEVFRILLKTFLLKMKMIFKFTNKSRPPKGAFISMSCTAMLDPLPNHPKL
jgi:hypothetical protein